MDAVKRLIEQKRSTLAEDFRGRKYVRRSEMDQRQIQRLREEEKKEVDERGSKSRASQTDSDRIASALAVPAKSASKFNASVSEEEKIDDLVLPRTEAIRLLRVLKHPVTLFGEDDDMRLARLKALLKAGVTDPDNELMEGQRNDFLRDLADLRKRERTGLLEVRKDKAKEMDEKDETIAGVEPGEQNGETGPSGRDNDKDTKKMKSNFDDLCDEDKILVFFKRLLQEWEQEIEDRMETEKRSSKGKSGFATFKQCARYIDPLFKMCRRRILPDDISCALVVVVNCCLKRDYMAAMDQYIKLAIGNAPWPIGVTMVGIHERSAREKIYTNSVAHIMNDETTRKYLQSVKRLMTLCQRRYPSVPSKSVEFNSLANGSDLNSLLAEERSRSAAHAVEERLQLPWIT